MWTLVCTSCWQEHAHASRAAHATQTDRQTDSRNHTGRRLSGEWLQAWAFIIAREVEAPQRFQAIQSHRAAQAILHQQTQYVAHLLETAVVAEDDGRHLLRSAKTC